MHGESQMRKLGFLLHMMSISKFFFFQAEDGIRDVAVTGVQTCALPIFATGHNSCAADFTEGALASNVQKQHRGGRWVRVEPLRRLGILCFELGIERRALG